MKVGGAAEEEAEKVKKEDDVGRHNWPDAPELLLLVAPVCGKGLQEGVRLAEVGGEAEKESEEVVAAAAGEMVLLVVPVVCRLVVVKGMSMEEEFPGGSWF